MERKHNAAKSLRCKIASPDCNKFGLGLVRVSTYHVQASRQLDGSTRLRKKHGRWHAPRRSPPWLPWCASRIAGRLILLFN